jgi:hypothetical protein
MNKKVLLLLLLSLPLCLYAPYAPRMVYFNNKTYLPEEKFSFFLFSWHKPNEPQDKDGTRKQLDPANSREFGHFPKQINLDVLKPRYSRHAIPTDDIVDLKIVTEEPSGLKTRSDNPQIIYLTGSKRNLKPGVYDVVVSNFAIHLNYVGEKK